MTLYQAPISVQTVGWFDGSTLIVGPAGATVNAMDPNLPQRWQTAGGIGGIEMYMNLPEQPLPVLANTWGITDTGATISDAVATIRARPISDTGAAVSDVVTPQQGRAPADTGATISDTVATNRGRAIADTGASVSDSVGTIRVHGVADTGTTVTDAVAPRANRGVADTGASVSDAVATTRNRAVADTGSTISDAVGKAVVHGIADTGATISDGVRPNTTRPVSDTGAAISDSVATSRNRVVSDAGTAISDVVATTRIRGISDAGALISDSVAPRTTRGVSDTGTVITDSVVRVPIFGRGVTDTGATISDSVATLRNRQVSDTGATISDQVATIRQRGIADTGASVSDSVSTNRIRGPNDTGATITDSVATRRSHGITDTGATIADTIATRRNRGLTDTGTAITDTIATRRTRMAADTGASVSDAVVVAQGRAPPEDFAMSVLSSEDFAETVANGWGTTDQGATWTTSGGASTDYQKTGSAGTQGVSGASASRLEFAAGVLASDWDVRARFALTTLPAAGTINASVVARRLDGSNFIRAAVTVTASGTGTLDIIRTATGVATTLTGGTITTPISATQYVWIRLRLNGARYQAKVWADGAPEPSTWSYDITDGSPITGYGTAGLRIGTSASFTGSGTVSFKQYTTRAGLGDQATVAAATRRGDAITDSIAVTPFTTWIVTKAVLDAILANDSSLASILTAATTYIIGTSRNALTPAATLIQSYKAYNHPPGGDPAISPTTNLSDDIANSTGPQSGVTALMYDNERWNSTPDVEQSDPGTYMANFVALAHAHSYPVILAPARDLMNATTLNGTYTPVCVPNTGESIDDAFLRCGIPNKAAQAGPDLYHLQSQADQLDPTGKWLTLVMTAYTQVQPYGIAMTAGVSSGLAQGYATGAQMLQAAAAVHVYVQGFWLNAASGDSLAVQQMCDFLHLTSTQLVDTTLIMVAGTSGVVDTGAAINDTIVTTRARAISDTGTTVTSTVATSRTRGIADTGTAISDAVTHRAGRGISDTGAVITDAVTPNQGRAPLLSDSAFGRLVDTFSGTTSNGWASPVDSGQSWAAFGGTLSGYSESSGKGRFMPTGTGNRFAVIAAQQQDGDYYLDFDWTSDPAGTGSQATWFLFRLQSNVTVNATGYRASILKAPGAAATVGFNRMDGATSPGFGGTATIPGDISAGTTYRIHLNVSGSTFRVNVYPASGAEPSGYQQTATDATYPSGIYLGLGSIANPGNTNIAAFEFDNLSVPLTLSDSVARGYTPAGISDVGATISDSVATTRRRILTDTGVTISDQVATLRQHGITDTGTTLADAVRHGVSRGITDTGSAISDTVTGARGHARSVTDVGTTISDHIVARFPRTRALIDTGAAISDVVSDGRHAHYSRGILDRGFHRRPYPRARLYPSFYPGSGPQDVVAVRSVHRSTVNDVGATISDHVTGTLPGGRIHDVGATIGDTVRPTRRLHFGILDTGATITDAVVVFEPSHRTTGWTAVHARSGTTRVVTLTTGRTSISLLRTNTVSVSVTQVRTGVSQVGGMRTRAVVLTGRTDLSLLTGSTAVLD